MLPKCIVGNVGIFSPLEFKMNICVFGQSSFATCVCKDEASSWNLRAAQPCSSPVLLNNTELCVKLSLFPDFFTSCSCYNAKHLFCFIYTNLFANTFWASGKTTLTILQSQFLKSFKQLKWKWHSALVVFCIENILNCDTINVLNWMLNELLHHYTLWWLLLKI